MIFYQIYKILFQVQVYRKSEPPNSMYYTNPLLYEQPLYKSSPMRDTLILPCFP